MSSSELGAAGPHVLREYALLADGERGALVGPRGDFAWMCFPSWHDEAIFSSLLGGGGAYVVVPRGRYVWGGYYEPRTLIWHSRWVTDAGAVVESREALALPADAKRAVVLRRVRASDGEATMDVVFAPSGRFGAEHADDLARRDDGSWSGRVGRIGFLWQPHGDATAADDETLELSFTLAAGEHRDFVLAVAHGEGVDAVPDADVCWDATESIRSSAGTGRNRSMTTGPSSAKCGSP